MQVERASGGFHIDLDDFLTGLLLLANELVSLSFPVFLFPYKFVFAPCEKELFCPRLLTN